MMKKMISIAIIGIMFPMVAIAQKVNPDDVKTAVERIMADYPASTLQDIYKSFFQDKFGPEHIISDTIAARKYLLSELNRTDIDSVVVLEPTGIKGNYIRVGLGAIKSGKVDVSAFLSAFIRSANVADKSVVEQWPGEWAEAVEQIDEMNLNLENYEADKEAISQILQQGRYVMHHSSQYREAYNPHYRIIAKGIFETEILPLLNK
jgi:hypothetical protein